MLEVKIMAAGYCTQLHSAVFPKEAWRRVRFPAMFALLKHPSKGYILFDTGYAEHLFEASRRLPYWLYTALVPVVCSTEQTAKAQLLALGIQPQEVRYVIISHFHADHIAGLKDFPQAQFICSRRAYRAVEGLKGFAATRQAFLPSLLPGDFASRCQFAEDAVATPVAFNKMPFAKGFDLFGDASVVAVFLEGHAIGQLGLVVKTLGSTMFFVADAVWHLRALREGIYPAVVSRFFMPDWSAFKTSFDKLHSLQKHNLELKLIPSHCQEVYEAYVTPI